GARASTQAAWRCGSPAQGAARMNRLDRMPGDLFRIIADAAKSHGGTRPGSAPAGGPKEAAAFRELLGTVSRESKAKPDEHASVDSEKPKIPQFHAPHSPVLKDGQNETRHEERHAAADRRQPAEASSQQPDPGVQLNAQHRLSLLSPIA